jgi:hypothetical protein
MMDLYLTATRHTRSWFCREQLAGQKGFNVCHARCSSPTTHVWSGGLGSYTVHTFLLPR